MTNERQQLRFLGQAIRSVRDEKTLSVADLAIGADISLERLKALERGELDPDYELLIRLAECLDTRPSAFIIRAEDLSRRSG